MGKMRTFFVELPRACGVSNHGAWGKMNELAFDHEKANLSSAFSRKEWVTPQERLAPAFGFSSEEKHDPMAAAYAKDLALLASLAYGRSKGIGDKEEVDNLTQSLALMEPDFPSISALLTVQEASVMTNWD